MKTKYFLSAFGAAALWGFMSIPLRALSAWSAEEILYYRIWFSLLVVWGFIFLFRKQALRSDWKYVRTLNSEAKRRLLWQIVLASIFIFGNWFTFIYAVNLISVQSAAFAYMVCPLLTTLCAYLVLKEKLSLLNKWGLAIAFVSVVLLSRGSLVEVCWSVSMAALYAFYLVVQRLMKGVDKLNVLAVQITFCSLLVLPLWWVRVDHFPLEPVFWTNIGVIAVLFTVLPLYMSMFALNGISSSTVGVLIYINPIISFAVATLYFGESVSSLKLFAYGILLVAVVLFNWEMLREIRRSRTPQLEKTR